jgi:hypothetical protein
LASSTSPLADSTPAAQPGKTRAVMASASTASAAVKSGGAADTQAEARSNSTAGFIRRTVLILQTVASRKESAATRN